MKTPTEKLNRILFLLSQLPDAVLTRMSSLGDIKQHLEELQGRTCTGSTHWRDENKEAATAKLYILHRTDQSCPIHGKPEPGKRLRTYIGTKPERIADALNALDLEKERKESQRKLDNLTGHLDRILYETRYSFSVLGHPIPAPDGSNPTPPLGPYLMKTK